MLDLSEDDHGSHESGKEDVLQSKWRSDWFLLGSDRLKWEVTKSW